MGRACERTWCAPTILPTMTPQQADSPEYLTRGPNMVFVLSRYSQSVNRAFGAIARGFEPCVAHSEKGSSP